MPQERDPGKTIPLFAVLLTLGACTVPVAETSERKPEISAEAMTRLGEMAAPYQDIRSVELRPEDGCYWYRHDGPVETTMLPLRTADGRPICAGRVSQAEA